MLETLAHGAAAGFAALAPFVLLLKDFYIRPTYVFSKQLAPVIEAEWQDRFDTVLPFVGGDGAFSYGVAFYGRSDAISFPYLDLGQAPWIDPDEVERRGMVVLCRVTDAACLAQMAERMDGMAGSFQLDLTATGRLSTRPTPRPRSGRASCRRPAPRLNRDRRRGARRGRSQAG